MSCRLHAEVLSQAFAVSLGQAGPECTMGGAVGESAVGTGNNKVNGGETI